MEMSILVTIEFLKYLVFEKPKNARRSTPKETRILLHVYVFSRFLTAADDLHRCGFSQVLFFSNGRVKCTPSLDGKSISSL